MVPTKVNPYSVIDITPLQEDQPPSPDANTEEEGVGLRVPSGYSVPVPCGYAVPSNLPLLLPAYSSPVIIRAESVEEEGTCVPPLPQLLRVAVPHAWHVNTFSLTAKSLVF